MQIKHLGLSLLVLALGPGIALAANDLTLTTDTTILSVGGTTLTVNQTGTVDSITVDTNAFSVTLSPGKTLKVTSTGRKILSVTGQSSATVTEACTSSANTNTISLPSSASVAETITVTPLAATCTVPSTTTTSSGGGGGGSAASFTVTGSSGGGGGSSSSGSSSTSKSPSAVTPATPATPTVTSATPASPSAAAVLSAPGHVFSVALKLGQKSADVLELQKLLNSDPETQIAAKGAGSPGQETNLYGPATKKAVQKFQIKWKIAKKGDVGFGNLGPATRAKMNELAGNSSGEMSPAARAAMIQTLNAKLLDLMQQLAAMLKKGN